MKKFIKLLLLLVLVEYVSGPLGKCCEITNLSGELLKCYTDVFNQQYFCDEYTCISTLLCQYGTGSE